MPEAKKRCTTILFARLKGATTNMKRAACAQSITTDGANTVTPISQINDDKDRIVQLMDVKEMPIPTECADRIMIALLKV